MTKKFDLNSKPLKFKKGKALRNASVAGSVGAIGFGLVAGIAEYKFPGSSANIPDLWQAIGNEAAIALAGGVPLGYVTEYINHKLDDPSPVFDGPTTALYSMVGMVFCFLLFVMPALQLDLAVAPNDGLPGLFSYLALFLSIFLVTIMRGLLVNLGLVRSEEDYESQI